MYCEKCGLEVNENERKCQNCGNVVNLGNENDVVGIDGENKAEGKRKILEYSKFNADTIYFVIAGIVLVMFFIAASDVYSAGDSISKISSVGGKTLEEAYYSELGGIYSGMSIALSAIGITLSSILVWVGIKVRMSNSYEKMSKM